MRELILAMRPRQWTKNVLVFAGLVFDQQLFDGEAAARVFACFILICALTSAVYLFNDLVDIESDRQHPTKRKRPLASGALSPGLARVAALILSGVSLLGAYAISPHLLIVFTLYLILQFFYNARLKRIIIVDLIAISTGFVLRVAAGTVIILVAQFSPWLYVCTALLALFLVIGKRRQELRLLRSVGAPAYHAMRGYGQELLDDLLRVITTSTLIAYLIYTIEVEQATLGGVNIALVTTAFVFYALFRYLHLLYGRDLGGVPEDVLFSDRPLQLAILLWGLSYILILYVLAPAVQT